MDGLQSQFEDIPVPLFKIIKAINNLKGLNKKIIFYLNEIKTIIIDK
jgi:hypothetical protein